MGLLLVSLQGLLGAGPAPRCFINNFEMVSHSEHFNYLEQGFLAYPNHILPHLSELCNAKHP